MKNKHYLIIIIGLHMVSLAKVKSANGQTSLFNNEAISRRNGNRIRRDTAQLKKPPCDEDQLMLYLAEIQVINPENLINLATLESLKTLCHKISVSLSTMDSYLKTCEPPQENDLYIELIKGVDALHEKLCTEGKFKTAFNEHSKCLHDLHNDFEDCNGPADWNEDNDKEKVCKYFRIDYSLIKDFILGNFRVYQDIADCYYVKAAKLCGVEAARLIKELIIAVINSILVIKCDIKKINPVVADAMPALGKKNKLNMILITILFLKCILQGLIFSS